MISYSGSEMDTIKKEIAPLEFYQDILDSVNDSSELVLALKDLYRSFQVKMYLYGQKDAPVIDSVPILIEHMKSKSLQCDSLYDRFQYHDDSLELLIKDFIQASKSQFDLEVKINQNSLANSDSLRKEVGENVSDRMDRFTEYLYARYKSDRFVSFSSDEYWKRIDKKQYVRSEKFEDYLRLKKENPQLAVKKLFEILNTCETFQEMSIYGIDLADFYMTGALDTDTTYGDDWAIAQYSDVMRANKYSLYLFEAWIKWRTVTQYINFGSSKSSFIANDLYNEKRDKMALVILRYIVEHPEDEMAINQFLLFATHNNIHRFGSYPYGNQNIPEYFRLFKTDE